MWLTKAHQLSFGRTINTKRMRCRYNGGPCSRKCIPGIYFEVYILWYEGKVQIIHTNCNEARPRERSDRGRFLPLGKKPLHSGSYEHRVPKIKKNKTFFCMYV